jgi:aklavinone 12-hydroxylase
MDDASIELGAVYRSSAVLTGDDPSGPLDDPRSHSWAAGTRAPYVALSGGRSTVDVAGHGFAVLVDGGEDDWRKVADEVQRELSVPIAVQRVQDEGLSGAALVRPDGVIAWRTNEAAAASGLTASLRMILQPTGR